MTKKQQDPFSEMVGFKATPTMYHQLSYLAIRHPNPEVKTVSSYVRHALAKVIQEDWNRIQFSPEEQEMVALWKAKAISDTIEARNTLVQTILGRLELMPAEESQLPELESMAEQVRIGVREPRKTEILQAIETLAQECGDPSSRRRKNYLRGIDTRS